MSTYWEELAERYEDLTAPHPKALYGAELHFRNESLTRLIGHAAIRVQIVCLLSRACVPWARRKFLNALPR